MKKYAVHNRHGLLSTTGAYGTLKLINWYSNCVFMCINLYTYENKNLRS